MEQKSNCSKLVQWSRIALTDTEGFQGGPQSLGFHQRGGCWTGQAFWAFLACQCLLGLTRLCCCSAEDYKEHIENQNEISSCPKKHSKCRNLAKLTMAAKLTLSQGWSNSLYLGRECQKGSGLVLLCQMEIARETIRCRGNINWAEARTHKKW